MNENSFSLSYFQTGAEELTLKFNSSDNIRLPKTVTAFYNDGGTAQINVKWDKPDNIYL